MFLQGVGATLSLWYLWVWGGGFILLCGNRGHALYSVGIGACSYRGGGGGGGGGLILVTGVCS